MRKNRKLRNHFPWSPLCQYQRCLSSHQLHRKRLLYRMLFKFSCMNFWFCTTCAQFGGANLGSRNNHKLPHLQTLPICCSVTHARDQNRCPDLQPFMTMFKLWRIHCHYQILPIQETRSPACMCSWLTWMVYRSMQIVQFMWPLWFTTIQHPMT